MNECDGCPIYEDGYKQYDMCYMCVLYDNTEP